jgi:hypothetical protein
MSRDAKNTPDTVSTSRARAFCCGVEFTPHPSRYSRSTPFFPLQGWEGEGEGEWDGDRWVRKSREGRGEQGCKKGCDATGDLASVRMKEQKGIEKEKKRKEKKKRRWRMQGTIIEKDSVKKFESYWSEVKKEKYGLNTISCCSMCARMKKINRNVRTSTSARSRTVRCTYSVWA